MFPLNLKFLRLLYFEYIGGTGQTDRLSDGLSITLMLPPRGEGRVGVINNKNVMNWREHICTIHPMTLCPKPSPSP